MFDGFTEKPKSCDANEEFSDFLSKEQSLSDSMLDLVPE
jgi:hypothetical protein